MQPFDLAVSIRRTAADASLERPGRPIHKLFVPGVNLVRMNLIGLGQLGHRRLLAQASKAIRALNAASIFRLA